MRQPRKHEMGEGGRCFCPKCNTRVEHVDGVRCIDTRCPQCGAGMLREGSEHDELLQQKQARREAG